MKPFKLAALSLLLFQLASASDAPPPTRPATQPATQSALPAPNRGPASEAAPSAKGSDQLLLDPTLVTGNRELPKVMYIVPWKKADLGELPGQPFNTLIDETLAPVDREVFQRQVKYYAVVAGKDQPDAPSTAAAQAGPSARQSAAQSSDQRR